MNRRDFFKVTAAVAVSAALPAGVLATPLRRRVDVISRVRVLGLDFNLDEEGGRASLFQLLRGSRAVLSFSVWTRGGSLTWAGPEPIVWTPDLRPVVGPGLEAYLDLRGARWRFTSRGLMAVEPWEEVR